MQSSTSNEKTFPVRGAFPGSLRMEDHEVNYEEFLQGKTRAHFPSSRSPPAFVPWLSVLLPLPSTRLSTLRTRATVSVVSTSVFTCLLILL